MPFQPTSAQCVDLGQGLLHVVLAERHLAGVGERRDLGRVRVFETASSLVARGQPAAAAAFSMASRSSASASWRGVMRRLSATAGGIYCPWPLSRDSGLEGAARMLRPPDPAAHASGCWHAGTGPFRTGGPGLEASRRGWSARCGYDDTRGWGDGRTGEQCHHGYRRTAGVLGQNKASDLHLSAGLPPMIRVDGDVRRINIPAFDHKQVHALVYDIMSDKQRRDYEEFLEVDFSFEIPGLARFRVNAFNQNRGAGAVFRTIPSEVLTLEDLGCPRIFKELIDQPRGLILVTGPTGSGKSTTLAAMLDHINKSSTPTSSRSRTRSSSCTPRRSA